MNAIINEQYRLAMRSETPPEILKSLVSSPSEKIRAAVAEHPEVAWTILCFLSFDHNPYISHRAQKTMSALKPEIEGIDQATARSVQELEAAAKIYETMRAMLQQRGRLSKNHAL